MSTNFKKPIFLSLLFMTIVIVAKSQLVTIEVPRTGVGAIANVTGPTLADVGPISMVKDPDNAGSNFVNLTGAEVTSVTFKLINQQYTGLTYSNLNQGLTFGATPTTAVTDFPQPAGVQMVGSRNVFANVGDYTAAPGGPTNSFYTADPFVPIAGTINTGVTPGPSSRQNGAAFIFTAAQVQYDQGIQNNPAPVPTAYSSGNKYYYGDLIIQFSRYVKNPVVHLAGLGGSYFYLPIGVADPGVPSNWKRTYFSTELQSNYTLTLLSGNSFFQVSGGNINNNASKPDGASVAQTVTTDDPFNHLGAASGSVRVSGTVQTLIFKIYLRGADVTDASTEFAWSAPGSASNNVPSTLRNPLTGDIWSVSVSLAPDQLIPLPATGINLNASLNNSDVTLSWKTLSEVNSHHFDIERSTDGVNFSKIGEKAAAGYSASDMNYNYADANMNASIYYYRLKLVDIDGKITYSNVAVVRKTSVKAIKVFPNPAVSNVNIEFANAKGSYTISLVNAAGQEVQSSKADITSSVQYVKLDRGSIAAGMYYVRVKENTSGETFSDKVLIK